MAGVHENALKNAGAGKLAGHSGWLFHRRWRRGSDDILAVGFFGWLHQSHGATGKPGGVEIHIVADDLKLQDGLESVGSRRGDPR